MKNDDLIAKLREVSFATLGHFLERGFVNYAVRAMVPGGRIVGRAVTLRLAEPDAIAVNRALVSLKPGDVLVIDMVGDHAHACVGAVTQFAARCAGAAGIIVDGVVTDINELRTCQLPVFARGTTQLTTKLIDSTKCQLNVSVNCAGVEVHPGDIVMADDNGVLIFPAEELTPVIDTALQSDLAEPDLLARLRGGEPLDDVLATSFVAGKPHRVLPSS
ncbi:dimethylmenaquinone methyltransferase [Pseudomonas putida]|uniref:RraA family protein n=1 Tax=Pseudomonas putida TaxID=303 RepID=UPI000C2A4E1E|nr:dimethylmenaquinone methyltransferase [Pseudomonas putida]PJX08075.1 dimethylmenaquinone methyltransferase [Pseudomonas putida]